MWRTRGGTTGQLRPPGVSAPLPLRSEWEDVPEAGVGFSGKAPKATRERGTRACRHQNCRGRLFLDPPDYLGPFSATSGGLEKFRFCYF